MTPQTCVFQVNHLWFQCLLVQEINHFNIGWFCFEGAKASGDWHVFIGISLLFSLGLHKKIDTSSITCYIYHHLAAHTLSTGKSTIWRWISWKFWISIAMWVCWRVFQPFHSTRRLSWWKWLNVPMQWLFGLFIIKGGEEDMSSGEIYSDQPTPVFTPWWFGIMEILKSHEIPWTFQGNRVVGEILFHLATCRIKGCCSCRPWIPTYSWARGCHSTPGWHDMFRIVLESI